MGPQPKHLWHTAIMLFLTVHSAIAALSTATRAPTAELLAAVAPLDRGLDATAAQKTTINGLCAALADENPNPTPAAALDGDWELIYSDAPDITNLRSAGPFARLLRVGQK